MDEAASVPVPLINAMTAGQPDGKDIEKRDRRDSVLKRKGLSKSTGF